MTGQRQTVSPADQRPARRQWLKSCFASAALAACFVGSLPTAAQTNRAVAQDRTPRRGEVRHPLVEPLSKDDARAQLGAALQNALPMPAAAQPGSESQAEGVGQPTAVEVNLLTGEEKRSEGHAAFEALQDELKSSPVTGYHGPMPQADQADRAAERAQAEGGAQAESCADTWQARPASWTYPMSAQVKLYLTFPNGGTYVGTGTMIGSKYVLTGRDNVYNAALGGLATRVEVIPGLSGSYKPFGSAYATYIRYYTHGYSRVGLLTLDRHIGHSTGWLGYGSFTDAYISSRWGHLFGYPTTKDYGLVLYYNNGAISNLNWDWLSVGVTFHTGEMGAGMYLLDAYGGRYVFAVDQAPWYCGSWGSRLTDWVTSQLRFVITNGY